MEKRESGRINPSTVVGFELLADEKRILIGECKELASSLGYSEEEITGRALEDILIGEDKTFVLDSVKAHLDSCDEIEMLMMFLDKTGNARCYFVNAMTVLVSDGKKKICAVALKADKYFCKMVDRIHTYQEKIKKAESIVNTLQKTNEQDSLTRILNAGTTRRLSEEYLSGENKNCAIMVIDVDSFKRINDRYGHMVGDEVMICAAATIKKLFRSNDIVGRIGGDEFLVLMKDVSDVEIVRQRCHQIVNAFNEMKFDSMRDEIMSCSVGAAMCPVHASNYNALFLLADKAMYRSKKLGGNRYVLEEINNK